MLQVGIAVGGQDDFDVIGPDPNDAGLLIQLGVECRKLSFLPFGSNDISNIWPEAAEPRPGFHDKDVLEKIFHAAVYAGKMNLADAQREMATNWLAAYEALVGPGGALPTSPALASPIPASTSVPAQGGSASQQLVSLTLPVARGADAVLTAGADGTCSWTWYVGPSTTPGTWSITVTAGGVTQTYPFVAQ